MARQSEDSGTGWWTPPPPEPAGPPPVQWGTPPVETVPSAEEWYAQAAQDMADRRAAERAAWQAANDVAPWNQPATPPVAPTVTPPARTQDEFSNRMRRGTISAYPEMYGTYPQDLADLYGFTAAGRRAMPNVSWMVNPEAPGGAYWPGKQGQGYIETIPNYPYGAHEFAHYWQDWQMPANQAQAVRDWYNFYSQNPGVAVPRGEVEQAYDWAKQADLTYPGGTAGQPEEGYAEGAYNTQGSFRGLPPELIQHYPWLSGVPGNLRDTYRGYNPGAGAQSVPRWANGKPMTPEEIANAKRGWRQR